MPTYLNYKYIFFFISIEGRIRFFFPAESDPYPWNKMSDPYPCHCPLDIGQKSSIRYHIIFEHSFFITSSRVKDKCKNVCPL